MRDEMILSEAEVQGETERAVKARVLCSLNDGEPRHLTVWLPKSQISIEDDGIHLPAWLVAAKERELSEWAYTRYQSGVTISAAYAN